MRPKKRNSPRHPYPGVSMTDASSFADSPDLRLMLSSAPPPQEPVGTPWLHMNHEPTMAQPPPMGHAGGEAISDATFEFYPYLSSTPSHNPSLVTGFSTFPHGSGQPWCFNFQSVDIPFFLDQYPSFYQQKKDMQLYDYSDTHNNYDESLVDHSIDLTAPDHDLGDGFQSDATSTAQALNPSISLHDPSAIQTTNMATGPRLSMNFSCVKQNESEWDFVEKEQDWPKDEKFGPNPPPSSGSASPIDGPWQCIPWYLDQPQEVYSGYTAYGTSSPETLDRPSHDAPIMLQRPRKRGALSLMERQETSKTRRMAACLRCQMQRKRVRFVLPQHNLDSTNMDSAFQTPTPTIVVA